MAYWCGDIYCDITPVFFTLLHLILHVCDWNKSFLCQHQMPTNIVSCETYCVFKLWQLMHWEIVWGYQLKWSQMLCVPALVVSAIKENQVIHRQYMLNPAEFWKSSSLACINKHSFCIVCAMYGDLWCTIYVLAICFCCYEVFRHLRQCGNLDRGDTWSLCVGSEKLWGTKMIRHPSCADAW